MTGSYDSPLGRLRIEITEDAITGICLMESVDETAGSCPLMELCKKELAEYLPNRMGLKTFPKKGATCYIRIIRENMIFLEL